jgi:chitodextrinase
MQKFVLSWKTLAAIALILVLAGTVSAATVQVRFWSEMEPVLVDRTVPAEMAPAEAAIRALVAGPTQPETASGITSKIPLGVSIAKLSLTSEAVEVDLSADVLAGLTESRLEGIFEQFRTTLGDFPSISTIKLTSGGKPLASFLAAGPSVGSPANRMKASDISTSSVGLSGKKITVGPSHGKFWNGSGWYWQRALTCGGDGGGLEDTLSPLLVTFLRQYLTQDGATFYCPRQLDQTDCCNSDTGLPWWKMCAESWLHHSGAPSSVWANASGNTGNDSDADRSSDDIRARPLWADYNNTDIYIACHTNAGGAGTATGTETYHDSLMEHPEFIDASTNLATQVQNNVVDAIRTTFNEEPAWASRGVKDSAAGFGEIRIPSRPAILIELAFHDDCTRDALYMTQDDFFKSVAEWGLYKGVCAYFGNTPTWDKYSCEYVSDTIPTTMTPGQVYNCSVTLRNRGVCWYNGRGFHLVATSNNDSWFKSVSSVSVTDGTKPGDTCTFNFQLTGPIVGGTRTTEWRMVRDGFSAGFGPTVTTTVDAGTVVDTDPPTVPQNLRMTSRTITSISLAWDASSDTGSEVEGYTLYRNGVAIGTFSATTTTYTNTGLTMNTSYTYEVDAFDAFNNRSAKSDALVVSTVNDADPPTVPQNLHSTGVTTSTISLAWDASTDPTTSVAGYTVYRNGTSIGTVTGTTFTDTGRTQNTSYTYTVDAYDIVNNHSVQSDPLVVSTAPDAEPPTVPQNLHTTAVTFNNVAIAWNASTDNIALTGYTVYRNGTSIATTTGTTYNDTTVAQSSTYTYEVDAYDEAANHSAKSAPVTVNTPIQATWGTYNLTTSRCIVYDIYQTTSLRTGWSSSGVARDVLKAADSYMATMPAQSLVTGATFTVAYAKSGTYSSTASNPLNIYRIGQAWDPASVLWNFPWTAGGNYASVGTASQACVYPADGTVYTFRPSGANGWFPYGVFLKGDVETSLTYRKAWYSNPYPTLAVTYVPPTPTIRSWAYLGHYAQGVDADHVTRINTDHVSATYGGISVNESNIAPCAADGSAGPSYGNTYGTFKWKTGTAGNDIVDLLSAPFYNVATKNDGTTYAAAYVYNSGATNSSAYMYVGSDDDVKVYLNGSLVGSWTGAGRGAVADNDIYGPMTLNSGWNRLLLKVENGSGGYGLYARFGNIDRSALGGLTTFTSDATAPSNPTTCTEAGGALSGVWQTTVSAPSFSWSGAADSQGTGEGVSGIRGYKVYFGTDPAGTPSTFQTGSTIAPGTQAVGTYYLRVNTVDYALNASATSTVFTFVLGSPHVDSYGITNKAALDVATAAASATKKFTVWGTVTVIDANNFTVNDGSGTPIKVVKTGHGFSNGDYVSATGTLDVSGAQPVLTALVVKKQN